MSAGRPRRSSRRTLEEAAAELFLEQTYDGTTVDDIATRAGVSRNTFFNYFSAKSDVLWVDFDETIGALRGILTGIPRHDPVMEGVEEALVHVAADHPSGRVPWALTQFELMGTLDVLKGSGLTRFLAVSGTLEAFITERERHADPLRAKAAAAAVTAAAAAAAARWAASGVSREPLEKYVRVAVHPVCEGFGAAS
ncbi:TetR family transcriptional regulator [Paramicrobacterium humi]|uniref:TetR family transcriptional regulator n=1 Tax=Paramicrobacterium humi TaxID=640635 RepID=UPI001FDEBBC9|nr:TetR family transcriptional regulator [Microbacterium humi]